MTAGDRACRTTLIESACGDEDAFTAIASAGLGSALACVLETALRVLVPLTPPKAPFTSLASPLARKLENTVRDLSYSAHQ
jgi:hypothetical protein